MKTITALYTYKRSESDQNDFQIKQSIRLLRKNLKVKNIRIIVIGDDPFIDGIEVYPEENTFDDKFKTLAYAVQQGLKYCETDYILKMDADIYLLKEVSPDFFKTPFVHNRILREQVSGPNHYSEYLFGIIAYFSSLGVDSKYVHSVHAPYLFQKRLVQVALNLCISIGQYNIEETYFLLQLKDNEDYISDKKKYEEPVRLATYLTDNLLRVSNIDYDKELFDTYKEKVYILNTASELVVDNTLREFIEGK